MVLLSLGHIKYQSKLHKTLDGPLSVVVSTLLLLHSWCFLYPPYPCSPPRNPSPPQPPGWSFYRSQPCSPTPATIKCYRSDIRRWGRKQFCVFKISLLRSFVLFTEYKKLNIGKTSCAENVRSVTRLDQFFFQNTLLRSIGKCWLSSDHSTIY